jgi:imidazole glycerol-phosphate synthase subunit HisH
MVTLANPAQPQTVSQKTVGIVNSGLGNVGSVASALRFYKYPVCFINHPAELATVDVIILSGVGNYGAAMARLAAMDMINALHDQVLGEQKPLLGICLGMQLLADGSEEAPSQPGFGWIPGQVCKLPDANLRIPHMGWNALSINPEHPKKPVFDHLRYDKFYFMHSYHLKPAEPHHVLATTQYGDTTFVSAVSRGNILGVQFHPEKSQGDGLRVIRQFIESIT